MKVKTSIKIYKVLIYTSLLSLLLLFLVSCGANPGLLSSASDGDSNSDNGGSNSGSTCYKWELLPIGINVDDEESLEVLEIYNEIFDYEIFVAGDDVGVSFAEYEGSDSSYATAHVDCNDSGIISSGYITFSPNFEDKHNPYQYILIHELGHILGHGHNETGVMTEQIWPYGYDGPYDFLDSDALLKQLISDKYGL